MDINLFSRNFIRILSLPDLYLIIERDIGIKKDIEISSFLEDIDKSYTISTFEVLSKPMQLNSNILLANNIRAIENIDWLNIKNVNNFKNYYIGVSSVNFGSCYIDLDTYIRTYIPKSIFCKYFDLHKDYKGNLTYNEEIEKEIIENIKDGYYIELMSNITQLTKDNEEMKKTIRELKTECINNNPILLEKHRKNDPLRIAIEVRNQYWKDYPENIKSNKQIQEYIIRNYGIAKTAAEEIEKIACPIDRKKN